jgi:hypothetical protein
MGATMTDAIRRAGKGVTSAASSPGATNANSAKSQAGAAWLDMQVRPGRLA